MEHRYVYSWRLRPRHGLEIELRIEAPSAVVARREVASFLEHHDGLGWAVYGVRRRVAAAWEDPDARPVTPVGPASPRG